MCTTYIIHTYVVLEYMQCSEWWYKYIATFLAIVLNHGGIPAAHFGGGGRESQSSFAIVKLAKVGFALTRKVSSLHLE